jgi:hypothetical protein
MLCSRGGRNIQRYEGESLVTKGLLTFEKKFLLLLKRKARLLHYSSEQ